MMNMPEEVPPEVSIPLAGLLRHADCDATVAAATGLGATVIAGPMAIPAGRFAVLGDPAGAVFGVIALATT